MLITSLTLTLLPSKVNAPPGQFFTHTPQPEQPLSGMIRHLPSGSIFRHCPQFMHEVSRSETIGRKLCDSGL
jgi:hypothetical protein